MLKSIVFDADDTLWQTDQLYEAARRDAVALMAQQGLGLKSEIEDLTKDVDNRNFDLMGFSIERFPKSLVDTYSKLCGKNQVDEDPTIADKLTNIGKGVFSSTAQNISGVNELLNDLRKKGHQLYLWTQGDKCLQERRIDDSGLRNLFTGIRIISDKSTADLSDLIKEWSNQFPSTPNEWWVVGNSIRSDINPAIAADVSAIWIPSQIWDREKHKLARHVDGKVYLAETIQEIRQIIEPEEIEHKITSQIDHGQIVYLFVSAYHDLYRQYVLDILAYPRGYIFRFPYDKRWLPQPFRERSEEFWQKLAGKTALIVYVDERMEGQPRRSQRFFPIRKATIISQDDAVGNVGGGMVNIKFQLEDYVNYGTNSSQRKEKSEKYHNEISSLDARPRQTREQSSYLVLGPQFDNRIFTEVEPKKDDDAWQSIISVLGELQTYVPKPSRNPFVPSFLSPFENAMFCRVGSLQNLSSKRTIEMATTYDSESGYELRGSQNYRLNLVFYHPQRPPVYVRRTKMIAEISSEEIKGIGPMEIPLNFRYDRRHVDFITTQVFHQSWGSLSLKHQPPSDAPTDESVQVVTPEPYLLFQVNTNRWAQVLAPFGFGLFVAIGSLSLTLSNMIVALIPNWAAYEAAIAAFISILGSVGSTSIIFYLYRKLR